MFENCSHSPLHSYVVKALAAAAFFALAALLYFSGCPYGELSTTEGRCAYLAARGYTADPASETVREITLPREFDDILEDYNRLQLTAGYDLHAGAGRTCLICQYELIDYPGWDGRVIATLYLCRGRVIAGDVHTASIEGFLRAL